MQPYCLCSGLKAGVVADLQQGLLRKLATRASNFGFQIRTKTTRIIDTDCFVAASPIKNDILQRYYPIRKSEVIQ